MKTFLLRVFSIVATFVGVVAVFTMAFNHQRPWATHKVDHTPTVRKIGYPIVQKVIDQTKQMTVLISVEGFGGSFRGTGVLIDSTTVLTCYHMVETTQDDEWIYPYPGRRVVKGHPVEGDRAHDLAILKLDEPVVIDHYATFSTNTVVGQPITIVGNTEGAMRWFVSYGLVSAYFNGYIVTDGLIRGGNSGGPWVNDKGQIVAISDWGYQENGVDMGINGGVAASDIVRFVDAYQHPVNWFAVLFGTSTTKGK